MTTGYHAEDPRYLEPGIGLSPTWKDGDIAYDCPLRAMAAGWRLAGPAHETGERGAYRTWLWTFVRDVPGAL